MAEGKTVRRKVEPVYEKLEPDSCMIISKSSKDVLIACNKKGEVTIKRLKIPTESS
jgi:hypothetical protein